MLCCWNVETHRQEKEYRDDVVELRKNLLPAGHAVSPNTDELDAAWEAYERRLNADSGVVDQISFISMNRHGIREAFTNDEHFRAAGFITSSAASFMAKLPSMSVTNCWPVCAAKVA